MAQIVGAVSTTGADVNTTSRGLLVQEINSAAVDVSLRSKATYMATSGSFTPIATPQDMAVISAGASKDVWVLGCQILMSSTAAIINQVYIIKRSALDTGGTMTTDTNVPLDAGDAAAGAVVGHYAGGSANTPGASVGNLAVLNVNSPILATGIQSYGVDIYPNSSSLNQMSKPIKLRKNTGDQLCVNFNGAALPSGTKLTVNWLWTEE